VDHRSPRGRYRGRRRVPPPPRNRYAAVVAMAAVGAGVVALGSNALPDLKDGQTALGELDARAFEASTGGIGGGTAVDDRAPQPDRATRGTARTTTTLTISQQPARTDLWLLPLHTNYAMSSPFGERWGTLHPGVDLTAVEGTQYYAVAPGKVIVARYNGGYGYNVMIEHDGGAVSVYGHSSKLIVKEGQQVEAGQLLGLTGNTGFSTGPHLHFEIRVDGKAIEPTSFMRKHGVDLRSRTEVAKGGVLP
jgi:murein DD-endopeptidase MepM/ murein hydrolase activator NlpD